MWLNIPYALSLDSISVDRGIKASNGNPDLLYFEAITSSNKEAARSLADYESRKKLAERMRENIANSRPVR